MRKQPFKDPLHCPVFGEACQKHEKCSTITRRSVNMLLEGENLDAKKITDRLTMLRMQLGIYLLHSEKMLDEESKSKRILIYRHYFGTIFTWLEGCVSLGATGCRIFETQDMNQDVWFSTAVKLDRICRFSKKIGDERKSRIFRIFDQKLKREELSLSIDQIWDIVMKESQHA